MNKEKILKKKLLALGGKVVKLPPMDISNDPLFWRLKTYKESEQRKEIENKAGLKSIVAEAKHFNATKNIEERAFIFISFLNSPIVCRFIIEPGIANVRSEYKIRVDPPIGGKDSQMIKMEDRKLIIMEREVFPDFSTRFVTHKTSPWKKKRSFDFSQIKKIEVKHYIKEAYNLIVHI